VSIDTAWAVICGVKRGAQFAIGVRGRHLWRCPNWRGWVNVMDDHEHVHTYPVRDSIIHEASDECPCGPLVEAVFRVDGSNGWTVLHHSLDGREAHE
jgi:hypothetical protein